MRSLRLYLPNTSGIRVNVICAWITDTIMVSSFAKAWKEEDLPASNPLDIAKIALGVACQADLNGESI